MDSEYIVSLQNFDKKIFLPPKAQRGVIFRLKLSRILCF